jgi:hypothetical protein
VNTPLTSEPLPETTLSSVIGRSTLDTLRWLVPPLIACALSALLIINWPEIARVAKIAFTVHQHWLTDSIRWIIAAALCVGLVGLCILAGSAARIESLRLTERIARWDTWELLKTLRKSVRVLSVACMGLCILGMKFELQKFPQEFAILSTVSLTILTFVVTMGANDSANESCEELDKHEAEQKKAAYLTGASSGQSKR